MGISHGMADGADGVAEVVIDVPPVNALDVKSWFDLADTVRGLGASDAVRVVIVAAEGRGFYAGVDIKEIQREGSTALVGVNRGCAAAFAAVYECEVPVISAVQRVLPRRRHRHRRQLRHHRRVRATPPSACPRWTGAPSGPPPTSPGWCPSTRCGP